ncbi:hypothetical protein H4I95_05660 [Botrytis cinerea]
MLPTGNSIPWTRSGFPNIKSCTLSKSSPKTKRNSSGTANTNSISSSEAADPFRAGESTARNSISRFLDLFNREMPGWCCWYHI